MVKTYKLRDPASLSSAQKDELIRQIQILFYIEQDEDEEGNVTERWDPEKEKDEQMLDAIDGFMDKLELKPRELK